MQKPIWTFAFASAVGNSHISETIPCQDHCKVLSCGNFTIAVVSDGAGSCKNSDIGSKQVCEFCLYHFEKLVTRKNWNSDEELPSQEVWHKYAKRTLSAIKSDLENFSLDKELDFKSLSSTVIITIAFETGLLITHIGDGRAGFCDRNSEWHSTITPFHGELANQTVFITSEIWDDEVIDKYIESKVITEEVTAFCLLSDGCEKASFECNLYNKEKEIYFDPNKPFALFFNPNLKILRQLHKQGKSQDETNSLWKKFLESGNEKLRVEPDDKTLILGVRLIENL